MCLIFWTNYHHGNQIKVSLELGPLNKRRDNIAKNLIFFISRDKVNQYGFGWVSKKNTPKEIIENLIMN